MDFYYSLRHFASLSLLKGLLFKDFSELYSIFYRIFR